MANSTTIQSNQDSLTLQHLGARILLTLDNIPILTSINRGDDKTGSTHPCTPIFGPDHKNLFGLNQHGNTRNEPVQVNKVSDTHIKLRHQISDQGYPSGMQLDQELILKNGTFTLTMTHTNTGTQPAPVNAGQHCYFHAPKGFQDTKLNNQDLTNTIQSHKDGTPTELKPTNLIQIPGQPDITLTQQGFNFAMLWVGTNSNTNQKDTNYVCIEPVEGNPNSGFFGSPQSIIPPQRSRTATFTLNL